MKTVSVIIPTYNRERYIASAIDSVLQQKLPKGWQLEVIVIDDGSTDATVEAIKAYGKQVTFVPLPHSGKPAVPRNVGLRIAKGELIAFQDSDDLWVPDKLLKQIPSFDDPKIVMSYGNAQSMLQDGTIQKAIVVKPAELKDGQRFATLLQHNVISTLTVMVRQAALKSVGYFNETDTLRAVEDYELWLRICARYPRGTTAINTVLAYYRVHDQNISTADDKVALQRLINTYNSLWRTSLTVQQRQLVETVLADTHENWSRLSNEQTPSERPPISIVMSVYNSKQYLKAAVESVLHQTYRNFEFIIIDDGSTDGSADLVASFDDPRIRLIYQQNHGLVAALNKGVRLARGRYIARQDADDISLPSRLEKELHWISQGPRRGLVSSFFTYIDESTAEPSITLTFPTKHLDLVRMLYYTNPFAHSAALIKKQAIVEAGGYSEDYGPNEDYDLWRKIAQHWEVGIIPEVLLWYRINPKSISHTKKETQHKFAHAIAEELWELPVPLKRRRQILHDARYYKKLPTDYADTIYTQYVSQQVQLAYDSLRRGKIKAGYPTALAALSLRPSSFNKLVKPMLLAGPKKVIGRLRP